MSLVARHTRFQQTALVIHDQSQLRLRKRRSDIRNESFMTLIHELEAGVVTPQAQAVPQICSVQDSMMRNILASTRRPSGLQPRRCGCRSPESVGNRDRERTHQGHFRIDG